MGIGFRCYPPSSHRLAVTLQDCSRFHRPFDHRSLGFSFGLLAREIGARETENTIENASENRSFFRSRSRKRRTKIHDSGSGCYSSGIGGTDGDDLANGGAEEGCFSWQRCACPGPAPTALRRDGGGGGEARGSSPEVGSRSCCSSGGEGAAGQIRPDSGVDPGLAGKYRLHDSFGMCLDLFRNPCPSLDWFL